MIKLTARQRLAAETIAFRDRSQTLTQEELIALALRTRRDGTATEYTDAEFARIIGAFRTYPWTRPVLEADEKQRRIDAEYASAARWVAVRGFHGERGDPLPDNLSVAVFDAISADLKAFMRAVEEQAKGIIDP